MTSFTFYSVIALIAFVVGVALHKLWRTNKALRDALVSESELENAATSRAFAVGKELSFVYDEALNLVELMIANSTNNGSPGNGRVSECRMTQDEYKAYVRDLKDVLLVLQKTPKNYLSLPVGRFEASGEDVQSASSNLDHLMSDYSRENIRFLELFVILRIMIEYRVNFKGAITMFYSAASSAGG